MITLEFTEEEVGTLIDALGTWMELPEESEAEEWLRRQDAGADLDMVLREAFNRRNDGWDAAFAAAAEDIIQAGTDARDDTREWLRRQDAGADLDMDLREAFNRRDDGWGDNAGVTFIQVGTYPPLADRIRISLSNDPIDW